MLLAAVSYSNQFIFLSLIDLKTLILKEHDELDLEALVDDFITFFNAGQETTANTLAFCFLELGQNPRVLEK